MRIKFPADIAISNALGVELVNLINHKLNKEPILSKEEIKKEQIALLDDFFAGVENTEGSIRDYVYENVLADEPSKEFESFMSFLYEFRPRCYFAPEAGIINRETAKRQAMLFSTMTNMEDFKASYIALSVFESKLFEGNAAKNREEFYKEMQEAEENAKKKRFEAIEVERKSKTYEYDDIAKKFFLSFLENERQKGNDILSLLEKVLKLGGKGLDFKA
ncbi:hypothetical protein [Campylobacter avium]|uniref:hypothetical protein n=1 Tax=Campylobacter avium TaxID=522485 RepID=UPI00255B65EC|nr:hypothetical protein [Campylobacter avium]